MSQVINNDIRDRSNLVLDAEPAVSNTANNTVEWACINKRLTSKCLVYHNDQWFTFHVEESGDYFMNIATQKCRDNMGVQLIIIEGNPCEVNTYKILECITRIHEGVAYVDLKNLKEKTSYLINIDGFNGDFCEFKIQLASSPWKPQRLVAPADSVKAKAKPKVHELFWEIKDDLASRVNGFAVYRRRETDEGMKLIRELGVSSNALGVNATKYTISDTLPGLGRYRFEVFGTVADSAASVLLAEHRVSWDGVKLNSWPPPPPKTIATFPVKGRPGTNIELVMLDAENPARLWTRKLVYDPGKHATMQLELEPWLKQGKKAFLMLVIDEEEREPVEYYFTTDPSGNVIRE
jgi:hypothetical protein